MNTIDANDRTLSSSPPSSSSTTTTIQPSRRQPRRPSWRRCFGGRQRQRAYLGIVWVLFGMLSYGVMFLLMMNDLDGSYSNVSSLNQQGEEYFEQHKIQQQQQQQKHSFLRKSESDATSKNQTPKNKPSSEQADKNQEEQQQQQQQQREQADDDWFFLGLWATFMAFSYLRIRVVPNRRQQALSRFHASLFRRYHHNNNNNNHRLSPAEQHEATVRTLRRINQEREALGQEPITLESYRFFQEVVNDRSIWRALAVGRNPSLSAHQQQPRGATTEQLHACPPHAWTAPARTTNKANEDNDDNDSNNVTQDEEEECSICLTSYQQKDMLRTLPCGHSFHKDCIDRWLEQSTSCPFCKQPLPLSPPPL